MENKRQEIELADIFRSHTENFLQYHTLCPEQRKAFEDIIRCRTSELGGHIEHCDNCGYSKQAYNSCRNRNCPKCQYVKKLQWVDKLKSKLLPIKHFHLVFTIPACLHKLFYINQEIAYSLLFKAATQTLMQCASNPDYLGAQLGGVAILHTWGQTLTYHPHLHVIVPAGGLSDDQMEWMPSNKKYLLPVKVLSAVFRGILCRLIENALLKDEMKLPDSCFEFKTIKNQCYQKNWVVYCEKPFACANNLINYLGNYTHRVAISNSRIKEFKDGEVTFCYKDYKSAGIHKNITIKADEFTRRFLQHILPSGFYKIRYFGFMAMCNTKTKLETCLQLIDKITFIPQLEGLSALEIWRNISSDDIGKCPKCKVGRMIAQPVLAVNLLKPG